MSYYARWGHYVARHSRRVIWLSVIAIVLSGPLAVVFRENLLGLGYQTPRSESDDATKLIEERTGVAERMTLVVSTKDGRGDRATLTNALRVAAEEVRGNKEVTRVILPGEPGGGAFSANGSVVTATVFMEGEIAERQEASDDVNNALPGKLPDGVDGALTGNSPLLADLVRVETEDLVVAEVVGLPIAFLVLMLALRSLVAAFLPLVLAIAGLMLCLGTLGITLLVADWNLFVETLAAMIGLGVGIDYAMLIVRRYREELATGKAPPDAVARTLETAGRTVTFSGAIVAVSMVGMAITGLPFFAESAVAVIIVVVYMVLMAVSLLPAILIRLGDKLDRFPLPERKSRAKREAAAAGRWEAWARAVMKRPVPVLLVGVVLLLLAASPALDLKTGTDLNARAMKGEPAADALAVLERAFPDASLAPVEVVVTAEPAGLAGATRTARDVMEGQNEPGSTLLGEVTQLPLGRDAALLLATPTVAADTIAADKLVRGLRSDLRAAAPEGSDVLVTGVTAELVDYTDETNDWTPFVLVFALGLSFLLLMWVFRSPVLALKAIIMNLLSIGAAFGLTVLVFQDGHGEGILDFTSLGYVQGWMPITLFMILFGLSMDYEVFLVSRIREEYANTGNTVDAIARGLGATGTVITAAAAIMMAIFGSFCLTSIPEIKQMGFGLAVAVLIDATIVRIALVPAFMKLVGRWNWWMPQRLDRLLPRFEHG